MAQATIYLQEAELTAIDRVADETDRSRSEVIRDALNRSPALRAEINAEKEERER